MLVPVRCFTCGNLIADKYDRYKEMIQGDDKPDKVFDELGVERYCCRRMLLTSIETIDQIIPFYEAMHRRNLDIRSELDG